MQENKSLKKYPLTLNRNKNMVVSAFGEGGGSLHLPCVWLANDI